MGFRELDKSRTTDQFVAAVYLETTVSALYAHHLVSQSVILSLCHHDPDAEGEVS